MIQSVGDHSVLQQINLSENRNLLIKLVALLSWQLELITAINCTKQSVAMPRKLE
jgi:hypothetical protein